MAEKEKLKLKSEYLREAIRVALQRGPWDIETAYTVLTNEHPEYGHLPKAKVKQRISNQKSSDMAKEAKPEDGVAHLNLSRDEFGEPLKTQLFGNPAQPRKPSDKGVYVAPQAAPDQKVIDNLSLPPGTVYGQNEAALNSVLESIDSAKKLINALGVEGARKLIDRLA